MANQRVNKEAKGDLAVTVVTKSYEPIGPYYRSPNDLRSQFAGSRSYIRTPSGAYPNPTLKPIKAMPPPTGTETVVSPPKPREKPVKASSVIKPSSVSASRSTSRIGGKTSGVAPGTGGRMTKAQREAPAGPRGNTGSNLGNTRTSSVSAGTGGRMTNAQRNEPAGPRGRSR